MSKVKPENGVAKAAAVPQQPKNDEAKDVSMFQLLRYADALDIFLMIIGTIASICGAVLSPLGFILYGNAASTFVDSKKYSVISKLNSTGTSLSSCYQTSSTDTDFNGRMNQNTIYYIILACVSLVVHYIAHVSWNTAAERQAKRIRNLLFEKIIRQEIAFFDRNTPGELNSKITGNVNQLQLAIGFKLQDTLGLFARGLGNFIFAMVTAWKFSIVFIAIVPFISVFTAMMVHMLKKYTIKEFQSYGKAGNIAQEVLSSLRTVIGLGIQDKEVEKYNANLSDAEEMTVKKGLWTGLFSGLGGFASSSMFAIGIYYGTYLARSDCVNYPAGTIMQSFFSMITVSFVVGQAMPFFADVAQARGAAKSVFAILEKESEIDVKKSSGKKAEKVSGKIEFKDVYFNYPQRADAKILQGLTLTIPAGKTVALCGSSGGGKSTVIQLLQRFYNPLSGEISLDGNSIKDLDLVWLRQQMALVSQEPVLFALSIKENIRLSRLDATDDEIIEACKQANAHNFIMGLKDNYNTMVGERGTQLSGGQKQRIAIARALIRNPKILLLDEATSALDFESEKIVQEALDKAKVGRTTIIIAHRLSTIRNADLIIGISGGKVGEMGTHNELMAHKGIYFDLVTRQTTKKEKEEIVEEESSDDEVEENHQHFHRIGSGRSQKSVVSLEEAKEKQKKYTFYEIESQIWKINRPEGFYIFLGALGQLISGSLFPANALIFTEIFNIFTNPSNSEQERLSLEYMGILFGIAALSLVAQLLYSYAFSISNARLTKRIRKGMFKSMVRQEIGWHDLDENRSSVLATRLSVNAALCRGMTNDTLAILSQGLGGLGVATIVSLVLNWKLALVMFAFIPISFIGGLISGRATVNTTQNGKTSVEEGGRITTECVENIKTVVSLGREDFFLDQFKEVFDYKYGKALALLHVQAFFYSLANSIIYFVQTVAFSFGFYLVNNDGLEVTNLYRVYASVTFSSMILGRLFAQIPDQKRAKEAAISSLDIINRKSKIDSMSQEGLKPDKVEGLIQFHDVHFRYPTRHNKILKGLNLTVNPHETTALVGQSGCGKSTTIQLLLRFYDVKKGKITLDGVDIRDLNIKWLRSQIGLVSQEPTLFNYSIETNIMFGDPTRSDIKIEEIMSAARDANIAPRIENLPDKYDTIVGTKGGQLSGGEKQRVAIARALIRKPKILLLDEATSALDTTSETAVQEALDKAQIGRTCICIAHRLSTIQNSAKISVFKEGSVQEEGTHSVLMSNKSIYYNLQMKNVTN